MIGSLPALRLLTTLLAGAVALPVSAQVAQSYARRDSCIEAGRLSPDQCDHAYRNALAEYEEKVPRYASRAQCERGHRRCSAQASAAGWDGLAKAQASYVPRFTGVSVSGAGAQARVLPAVEGAAKIGFRPRGVAGPDDKISGRRPVIGVAMSGRRGGSDPQAGRPYVKRGDRDDTVPVPMQKQRIGADVPPGLYVDPDGVEWYKPSRRR